MLHIPLAVGAATQSVVVSGAASSVDTVTPTTLVTRAMIEETPGASRTLGMEMITDYVPGAYMSHNMLHMRGGHQTSWLIDGVAIPNTKIASNVGPQIDPKDIDSLETQRGSYWRPMWAIARMGCSTCCRGTASSATAKARCCFRRGISMRVRRRFRLATTRRRRPGMRA